MSSHWHYQDEAFFNVVKGIRKVVIQLSASTAVVSSVVPGEMQQEMSTSRILSPTVKQGENLFPFPPQLVVEKLDLLYTLTGHKNAVSSVILSADGQTLISGSDDQTIKVWNLSTGKLQRTLTGHTGLVFSVALSADGQTLISGSRDQTIKVWKLSTGQELY